MEGRLVRDMNIDGKALRPIDDGNQIGLASILKYAPFIGKDFSGPKR